LLSPTKEEVHVFASVHLSVCLLSVSKIIQQEAQLLQRYRATLRVIEYFAKSLKITQGHWKMLSRACEPDSDYSPDAATGLLSLISFKRCNAEFYYAGKIPRIPIGHLSLQRRVVLKWFYSPRAVGTTLSEVHALYRVHL